ncbi:hypothetical protein H0H87_009624 [Tephrocybe sp. NHM501043]|nr:hypothetical protein H0H87_009624 [Tephrocybe sp. NHM501043]
MKQFSEVAYNSESQTVVIGAGLAWDEVYAALAPYRVNVVGGRVQGVGVAGFLLGGGYSWLTNQRGLGVDNIVAYELVKPTGEVVIVSKSAHPDLFFGLKGIVTRFVLKAFPQKEVWGGLITFTSPQVPDVTSATANFCATVVDPKASIITTYNYVLGKLGVALILFYDGPVPPPGIFDKFLAIPSFTKRVYKREFLSLVMATPVNVIRGQRIAFDTVPLAQYTPTLLDTILNETVFWGKHLNLKSGLVVSYDVEPFLPSILLHGGNVSNLDLATSAYPPSRAVSLSPFIICYAWSFQVFDDFFHKAIKQSAATIRRVAVEEGHNVAQQAVYPNYAVHGRPVEDLYGSNLPRLRRIREQVDPENVMRLAGGFKI